jgi:hypothetical protein
MSKQAQLGLIGGVSKGGIEDVPSDFLRPCKTIQEAMWVGIRLSSQHWESVGAALDYSKSHWSQILNCNAAKRGKGFKGMHPSLYRKFSEVTGNWAVYQFLEMERRSQLNHQRGDIQSRVEELRAELSALEARA